MDYLITKKSPNIVTNMVLKDMSELPPLSATDVRFQFGFSWMNIIKWRITPHNPRYGIVEMKYVEATISPYIEFNKTDVPHGPCRLEQFTHLSDQSRFTDKNMTDFTESNLYDIPE